MNRIQRAFERAASSYNQHAILQKQVAAGVEQLCLQYSPAENSQAILDIGAGTGYVTTPLLFHYPNSQVTALDISQNMLDSIPKHPHLDKVRADFMALPFAEQSFDLMTSSLALQWGRGLSQLFADLHRVLKGSGRLVFSTLLEDSLTELRTSWREIDQAPHVNQFVKKNVLQKCLIDSGFIIEQQRQETISLHYESAVDILKAIKGIGANTVISRQHVMQGLGGRKQINDLSSVYEQYRNDAGLPLSYSVYWLVLSKA